MTMNDCHAVLQIGFELFTHYGFKKTTMAEVAKRAGMSRPTLYARFENKEELFSAVLHAYVEKLIAETMTKVAPMTSLADRLEAALEIVLVRPFYEVFRSPLRQELLEIADPRIFESMQGAHRSFEAMFARLVGEAKSSVDRDVASAAQLGRMLGAAARGFKEHAKTPEELRAYIKTLAAVLRAAEAATVRPHDASGST